MENCLEDIFHCMIRRGIGLKNHAGTRLRLAPRLEIACNLRPAHMPDGAGRVQRCRVLEWTDDRLEFPAGLLVVGGSALWCAVVGGSVLVASWWCKTGSATTKANHMCSTRCYPFRTSSRELAQVDRVAWMPLASCICQCCGAWQRDACISLVFGGNNKYQRHSSK